MTTTPYLTTSANAVQLVRGTTKTFELTVLDDAGGAFDLTGASLWFTVKKTIKDVDFVVQKRSTDPSEIAITSAKEGKASIYLLPADTNLLDVREYVFDVWVVVVPTPPATPLRYLVVGPSTLELQDSVTRIQ